jgi:putative ABC transport system permease protein
VLSFSILAGLASAVIFGLVPAIRSARPDLIQSLRASGRTAGLGGGHVLRNAVVVAEVALSFVLLIGSGLMFRSFLALQRVDPGFDANNLLTFQVLGARRGQTPPQRAAVQRDLQNGLRAIPGVQVVSAGAPFPLTGGFNSIRWGKAEALGDTSKFQAVDNQFVLPGYFETIRTPLLAGRVFTDADNAPDRNLVIVDQFLAAKAFPGESAIGKRILIRVRTLEPEWVEIVGVVGHQRNVSLAEDGREQIYFTDGFIGHGAANRFAIRTSGDPASYSSAVRAEIARVDKNLIVNELQPMQALVHKAQSGTRFSLLLIGLFAVIAAFLAGVGLYGVLATVVRQRTAEIGVRMALGAAPATIFKLIVGHGLSLSGIGIVAGLIAAIALTRIMTSMLVGVKATDPTTFAAMAVLFIVIAALASWLPARRAASLDPNSALREE